MMMIEVGKHYVTTVYSLVNGGGVFVKNAEGDSALIRFANANDLFPDDETADTLNIEQMKKYINELDIVRIEILGLKVRGLPGGIADAKYVGKF